MPKKAPPPDAVAPVTSLVAPPPPSPIIQKLRQDWRWAGISQFIWTFSDAFGLIDWDIENLEADLDGDETHLLPELLAKMLYALTYNRQINRDNAFENLRKQYIKRAPETNPLGSLEEPIEWATLGLSQKVQILWELCEWQLLDPARFRALLKNEEEATTWRVDPLGWDKSGNTYFLFDDNRLWIQRVPPAPPRPPKKSSLKAKRAERALKRNRPKSKSSHKNKEQKSRPTATPKAEPEGEEVVDGPRRRTQVAFYGNPTPTAQALKRGGPVATPTSTRGTRSSARRNGDPGPSTLSAATTPSKVKETPRPLGTRVSRRLREVEDEWQQVPDEWLGAAKINGKTNKAKRKDEDDESELSDLTDEDEHEAKLRENLAKTSSPIPAKPAESDGLLTPPPDEEDQHIDNDVHDDKKENDEEPAGADDDVKEEEEEDVTGEELQEPETDVKEEESEAEEAEDDQEAEEAEDEEADDVKLAVKEANSFPEGFLEWEAICVTLYDWRTFPEQFVKSRDPDEKELYKMLSQNVGPTIIEVLVAKEAERIRQQAVLNRKRSSRIATKELEREEIIRRENAQREMEERMDASRREHDRAAREEAQAIAQERAREDRLKEREERAAAREEAIARRAIAEQDAKDQAVADRESRKRRRELGIDESSDRGSSAVPTPAASTGNGVGERWELACEVCRKSGWNVDEDLDLVCCDDCSRWQHTECHDRQDQAEGRRARNWDKVDFKCKNCRRKAARKRQRLDSTPQTTPQSHSTDRRVSQPSSGPYQLVNGSAPGPSPPRDPSRPPAPALQQGQYYLPYPPNAAPGQPAGYAVYYPPNGPNGQRPPPPHVQSPSTSGYGQASPHHQYPQAPSHAQYQRPPQQSPVHPQSPYGHPHDARRTSLPRQPSPGYANGHHPPSPYQQHPQARPPAPGPPYPTHQQGSPHMHGPPVQHHQPPQQQAYPPQASPRQQHPGGPLPSPQYAPPWPHAPFPAQQGYPHGQPSTQHAVARLPQHQASPHGYQQSPPGPPRSSLGPSPTHRPNTLPAMQPYPAHQQLGYAPRPPPPQQAAHADPGPG